MPIKASMILPFYGGRPEDVAVNTYYSEADPGTIGGTAFLDGIQQLYDRDGDANFGGFGEYLSNVIDRSLAYIRYTGFNPATGKETTLETLVPATIATASYTNNLPNEVALAVSYKAASVAPPQSRNRGRVFVGPLCAIGIIGNGPQGVVIPFGFVDQLAAGVAAVIEEANDGDASWRMYSPTDAALKSLAQVYVDNEFDTQRRRGAPSTYRAAAPISITP
uniref:Uncharacterized protein n=1 Tax=uncultured prokaryote TaxID=198431 RepID=A0A0H5QPZ7_9ZZZZ|nr:hypothetical protein [uncultured prokaryote]